jgi:hypothetical protein
MLLDPSGRVYPPFVRTPEQRELWDSCTRVAMAAWERFEPGRPTNGFPLNLQGNRSHAFWERLSAYRAEAKLAARQGPIFGG